MSRPTLPLLLCLFVSLSLHAAGQGPAFDIEVEAILSKAGCNAGTCHGNQNGKGGFKLSLRGQDPWFDYRSIVLRNSGRRVNLLDPAGSLLLKKPSMQVAHQGGKRLDRSSEFYRTVRDWIATGAAPPTGRPFVDRLEVAPQEAVCFDPQTQVRLSVTAHFSDGTSREISDWAVYESSNLNVEARENGVIERVAMGESTVIVRYLNQQVPVRIAFLPERAEFVWSDREPRNYVDEHVFAKLRRFRINTSQQCSDHVFLRRAYLDLLGIPPTAREARQFVNDTRANKRDQLIDGLLTRPEFADNWALKWADLLRVEENVLDRKGVELFHSWIRQSIVDGKPWNQFVAALLLARGSTYDNPPANYFRALRQTNVRGEAAARVFLGTRLQCAQCHNHPFDRWTQDDYYSWAALFAGIEYEIVENKRLDKLDKNQFVGEQLVQVNAGGDVKNPTTGQVQAPRFLGADVALEKGDERLDKLAAWLTADKNRQFARSQVNRLWYHLMGRGLVDPVDDFRTTNPATHPELLEALTDDFIVGGFDIRRVLRVIMQSETYQLQTGNAAASENYGCATVRRLSAEQLLDAQTTAMNAVLNFNGHPQGIRAMQLPGVHKVRKREKGPSPADRFLFAFGKPERLMTCECERSDSTTLSQALLMVNGQVIDEVLTQESNLIDGLVRSGVSLDDAIGEMYWSTLSRPPSREEVHRSHSVVAAAETRRQGLEDLAWALLNAKEFVFRQ